MNNKRLSDLSAYWRITFDLIRGQNPGLKYTLEEFDKIIVSMQHLFNNSLTDEEIAELRKQMDAEFEVYMPDGETIYDPYEHDIAWFTNRKDDLKNYYWGNYKKYLLSNGWENQVVESLDTKVLDKLANQLGDPASKEPFSRRGLVMGDVQSGKTANYLGLICKAADAGYRVIILLTGTTDSLRKQTQIRVEEGFIGRDSDNNNAKVGVGLFPSKEGQQIPISPTSRASDFTGRTHGTMFSNLYLNDTPYIFVTKKNVNTLRKIRQTLQNIDNDQKREEINLSLLIIDDEADNASVNTNDQNYDPSIINSEIRKLLKLFKKSNYVGFTATPFANIFIDPDSTTEMLEDDLFPKHFITSLVPPTTYVGPVKLFLDTNKAIKLIKDSNELFPLNHTKKWEGDTLFPSFYDAINTFLIANAIRDLQDKDKKNTHRSMMINVSRFISVQEAITELVGDYLEKVVNSVKHSSFLKPKLQLQNPHIKKLHDIYNIEYKDKFNWEQVIGILYDSIKEVQVYRVPTTSKKKLDYEKNKQNGLRAIVIGGLSLSRGLTLEGLMVSYLYRATRTFDVLLQMGRWFGYRNKPSDYQDLCRIWMLENTSKYFKEITLSINQLKDDFTRLSNSNKLPRDFGIRVRNQSIELGITSKNKMRNVGKHIKYSTLFGDFKETPFLDSNYSTLDHNLKLIDELVSSGAFESDGKKIFKKNVDKNVVINLINSFEIHEANSLTYFEKNGLIDFIQNHVENNFDIVFINGDGESIKIGDFIIQPNIRKFDLINEMIRINRLRLGSPSDPKFGLTTEQLNNLDKKTATKDYLIEGRNPILMIYPIQLNAVDEGTSAEKDLETLLKRDKKIPIGISIAFGENPNFRDTERTQYYVSLKTDWKRLMNEKDNEEDAK